MGQYRKSAIPVLVTARLVLRPYRIEDVPRVQELFPNPNVVRYLASIIPWPYPEDGAATYLATILPKIEAQEEYHWAILLKGHEEEGLIGAIGLTPASEEDNRGFWLAEPFWGKGYMSEATTAVNDFAFDVLGMEFLLLNNAQPNLASHRLKESVGAEIIGIEEQDFVTGRFPSVKWKLTAEAWRKHRSG